MNQMSKTNVFKIYNAEQDVLMIDYEGTLHGFVSEEEDDFEIKQMIEHTMYPSLI